MLFHQSVVDLAEYTLREKWQCLLQQQTTALCLMGVWGCGGYCMAISLLHCGLGLHGVLHALVTAVGSYVSLSCCFQMVPWSHLHLCLLAPVISELGEKGLWQCVPPGLNCVWPLVLYTLVIPCISFPAHYLPPSDR